MKLSILICSLEDRLVQRNRLLGILGNEYEDQVEILLDIDNGEKSIGRKRNDLLRRAQGDYIVFIDDDDAVSHEYIPLILSAINSSPDCIGIKVEMTTNGRNPEIGICSNTVKEWFSRRDAKNPNKKIYYRTIHHLCPVRRKLALKAMFPETNHGEDKDYSERIKPYLNYEVMIEEIIYYYLYNDNKPRRI